jgi:hypothetical protein
MNWSWTHFFEKMTSRQFWAYLITTAMTFYLLWIDGDHVWFIPLIWVWGIVTVLYMGGNILIDALGKSIEKANITINQNNSISSNISGTIGGKI